LNSTDILVSAVFNVARCNSGLTIWKSEDVDMSPAQTDPSPWISSRILPVRPVSDFILMRFIFNPIVKVNYSVERTRVGQITDYERLVLDIWTDGSITPMDALKEASEELVKHFFMFKTINREGDEALANPATSVAPEIFQTLIERLDLSPRTLNCLKRANISKVGEVLEMSDADLLKIRNFGEKSLHELRDKLTELGVGANDLEQVETEQTTAVVEEVQE
jgi:DNA-directed RNA polymerase alpha subunit